MFARITRFQLKPGTRDAAMATMESMKADIMALPGLKEFINVMNEDGKGYVVSVVETRELSDANADKVTALWKRMADHLAEIPQPEGFDVGAHWTK